MPSASTDTTPSRMAYRRRGEDVVEEFGTDVRLGLAEAEARTHFDDVGRRRTEITGRRPGGRHGASWLEEA